VGFFLSILALVANASGGDTMDALFTMKRTMPDADETPSVESSRGELKNVKLIGKGGMSLVFRAWQPSLERFVVIKRLRDELVQNAETAERFRREARALASVLHQNVAHVYDYIEKPGESFILMEYIEGLDLSAVIQKTEAIPPSIAACILLEVAKGLRHIHERGLIHRDIKPSNIRITNRGEVKLMDFGIVLQVENTSLTRPGVMVGSPSYLSPEQILGDKVSHQADIFLLGIVLYEMLSGIRPFKEEGGDSIYQRIREARYVQLRKMEPSVPRQLERIVEKCLKKIPDRRYSRVEKVILELEDFLGPEATANPQKYILKYLEENSVLKADQSLERFPTNDGNRRVLWARLRNTALAAAIAGAFVLGLFVSRLLHTSDKSSLLPSSPTQFSKPKPLAK
jgi:eukaryotic-like serine/threonine-protein kinase